jgi:hypothetical protein
MLMPPLDWKERDRTVLDSPVRYIWAFTDGVAPLSGNCFSKTIVFVVFAEVRLFVAKSTAFTKYRRVRLTVLDLLARFLASIETTSYDFPAVGTL